MISIVARQESSIIWSEVKELGRRMLCEGKVQCSNDDDEEKLIIIINFFYWEHFVAPLATETRIIC